MNFEKKSTIVLKGSKNIENYWIGKTLLANKANQKWNHDDNFGEISELPSKYFWS